MAEINIDKMAKDIAERALDEIFYDCKTIRELMKIVVEADYIGKWIPVSERLPEKPTGRERYWSSYHGKDIAADEYIVMIKDAEIPTSLYWTGDVWINVYAQTLDDCNITYEVTAWMPLPEPCKAKSEDKK